MILLLRLWVLIKGYLAVFALSGLVASGILFTGYHKGYQASNLKNANTINKLNAQLASIAAESEKIKKESIARDEFNRKLQENLGNEAITLRRNLSLYYRSTDRPVTGNSPDGMRGQAYSPGIAMSPSAGTACRLDAASPERSDDTAGASPGGPTLSERCAQDALTLILLQEWVRERK